MSSPVQELFLSDPIAGVYMLYGPGRGAGWLRTETAENLFYIGESVDVLRRVHDHGLTSRHCQWSKQLWTGRFRFVLLVPERRKRPRRTKESRFIAAAYELGLLLANRKPSFMHARWRDDDLSEETERIQQALEIFGYDYGEVQLRGAA